MATATANSLPVSGTFPVSFSPGLFDPSTKKRKRDGADELIALRYQFKPASVTTSTEGSLSSDTAGSRQLTFDTTSHGHQVFDVREESSKTRECVLVYDEATHAFVLHYLPSILHLTLNRSASSSSSSSRRPTTANSESSSSSASVPLAAHKRAEAGAISDKLPINESEIEAPRNKRSRASEPVATTVPRPTRGGKGVARKAIPAPAPNSTPTTTAKVTKGKGRGKGGAKKGASTKASKPPPVPAGKIKSAEIIEDSDEEYELAGDQPAEEDDEFARMVGESLAEVPVVGDDDDDDEDEDDDDDDEEEELGGARLVVQQQVAPGDGMVDGETEWL